jgi:4-hydroxyacetophenone monooxygenase
MDDPVSDRAALATLLGTADKRSLAATTVHLAGDPGAIPDVRDAEDVISRAVEVIWPYISSGRSVLPPSEEVLQAAMELAVGHSLDPSYRSVAREQMGIGPAPQPERLASKSSLSVTIIGAGVAGISAALKLHEIGISNISIYEKLDGPGGTWRQNTYPGCRVDTPSILYSFSFSSKYPWREHFSRQPDLLAYLEAIVADSDLANHFHYGSTVESIIWDENSLKWAVAVRDADGVTVVHRACVVIGATGILSVPKYPQIPGRERFRGPAFHSARWDRGVDLQGLRVAVLGTGASANQIVPAVAPVAAEVLVYQRQPHWIMSHPQYGKEIKGTERQLIDQVPGYREWYRFRQFWILGDSGHPMLKFDQDWPYPERATNELSDRFRILLTNYLESQLDGRDDLARALLPDYPVFTKRMIIDNGWFRALQRDNVRLISAPVEQMTETSIVTREGSEDIDVVVFATGFQTDSVLHGIGIRGRDDTDIRKKMDDRPEGYRGMVIAKCPNLFVLPGPNGVPLHGGSHMFFAECQAHYVVETVRYLVENHYSSFEVKSQALEEFVHDTRLELSETVWARTEVDNWYRGSRDYVTVPSPYRIVDLWSGTRRVEPDAFHWQ